MCGNVEAVQAETFVQLSKNEICMLQLQCNVYKIYTELTPWFTNRSNNIEQCIHMNLQFSPKEYIWVQFVYLYSNVHLFCCSHDRKFLFLCLRMVPV
jgi:hypothetical protein